MKAHYGYRDGSGSYYIIVDTDLCDGCGDCVKVCPQGVLEIVSNDYDMEGGMIASVTAGHSKKIKYSCAPCKPVGQAVNPPCVLSCKPAAISHSW